MAEVQGVFGDGAASLHTRSLKYGKLRNGVFLSLVGTGGGVVRARRQVWTAHTQGGEVDVVLGVNGYVWICKHTASEGAEGVGITNLEDGGSERVYEARNEVVSAECRREIARLAGVVRALVQGGVRVDEEMVMRGYEASLEEGGMEEEDGDEAEEYLGGERGKRVVLEALAAVGAARG